LFLLHNHHLPQARAVLPPEDLIRLLELLRQVSAEVDQSNSFSAASTSMAASTRSLLQLAFALLENHPDLFSKFCLLVQGS
jgi:hypothetical protein